MIKKVLGLAVISFALIALTCCENSDTSSIIGEIGEIGEVGENGEESSVKNDENYMAFNFDEESNIENTQGGRISASDQIVYNIYDDRLVAVDKITGEERIMYIAPTRSDYDVLFDSTLDNLIVTKDYIYFTLNDSEMNEAKLISVSKADNTSEIIKSFDDMYISLILADDILYVDDGNFNSAFSLDEDLGILKELSINETAYNDLSQDDLIYLEEAVVETETEEKTDSSENSSVSCIVKETWNEVIVGYRDDPEGRAKSNSEDSDADCTVANAFYKLDENSDEKIELFQGDYSLIAVNGDRLILAGFDVDDENSDVGSIYVFDVNENMNEPEILFKYTKNKVSADILGNGFEEAVFLDSGIYYLGVDDGDQYICMRNYDDIDVQITLGNPVIPASGEDCDSGGWGR